MATVKGVNRTIMDTEPRVKLAAGSVDGREKVILDSYEAAALAVADIIQVGAELPVGAIVTDIILDADALGAGVTLSCGDSGSATRYIPATVFTSAAVVRLSAIGGRHYAITSSTQQVTLTVGVGAATGSIKITIKYTHD